MSNPQKPGILRSGSDRVIPGLDGLRAISLLVVMAAHLGYGTRNFPKMPALETLGTFGVRVFFVLSGYLITSILLGEMEKTGTIWLRRFYYRRALRLFPAAYALIAVVAILASFGMLPVHRHDVLFAATYLADFHWTSGIPLRHLWSLAVEEQFYLIWPFALRTLRPKASTRLLLATVVAVPVMRVLFAVFRSHYPSLVGLFSEDSFWLRADALGTGCLLALIREQLFANGLYRRILQSRYFALVPLAALMANYVPSTKLRWLVMETVMNVAIAMTVDWSMRNTRGLVGRMLNARVMIAIGVLSYSLYLWQQLFLYPYFPGIFWSFPTNVFVAFAAAIASYYVIERPFLLLRTKWEPKLLPKRRELAGALAGSGAKSLEVGA